MSLFEGLFAGQQPVASSLFSTGSKFAALGQQQQQQRAASPAPAAPGGKKRRSCAGVPPSSIAEAKQECQRKKQRKEALQPHGSAAAAPVKQERQKQERSKAGPATGSDLAAAAAEQSRQAKKAPAAAEDERLPRTVFVGNLPATVKRKSLAQLFALCGTVESVRMRSLPLKEEPENSKVPRRGAIALGAIEADRSAHAYVVFAAEAAVDVALALNMTEFKGHHIRVDRAAPKAAKGAVVFDPQRSLFVGNLALNVENEEVIQLFGAGNVEAVRVVRDAKTGVGKGVAFVLFKTQEGSNAALKQRGVEFKGRALRLMRVKRQDCGKAAWQQGKGSSTGDGKAAGGKLVAARRKNGGKRPAVAARKHAAKQQER